MKRYTLTSLVLFIAMLSLSWDTIAQATITFYDGSSTAYNCGTATGTLTAACLNCNQIICWQEGTYNEQTQVFTTKNQYTFNSADPTLHYNFTPISASVPDSRYYRVGYTSNGSSITLYSYPFNVVAYPIPAAGTLSSSVTAGVNTASGQLTLTGATGTVTWYQVGSTTPLSLVNGNFSITQTTEFYASISSAPCTVTSNHVTVTIYKPGILSAYIGGPTTAITVTEGNKVNMTVYIPGSSVQIQHWEYSIDGGSTWTNFDYNSYFYNAGTQTGDRFADTHEIWTNTKFRALVYMGSSLPAQYTNVLDAIFMPYTQGNSDPTNGGNYLREQTVTISGITTPSSVDGLTANQKHSVTSYMDGTGRIVQKNLTNSGPSPAQHDIIGFATYDRLGRQATAYLPYASAGNDGLYRTNALTEQSNFYSNGTGDKVVDNPSPYATTIFEKSPLQKVTEQGDVGQAWQTGGAHSTIPTYSNNDGGSNQVRLIQPDGTSTQYYNNNELALIDVKDADGKHTQTITNKEGRTIVSRVQLDETVNGVVTPWLETYYVYTTSGAIKYIISPKGVAALKLGGWSLTPSILDQYVHQFTYDARGRVVEKKVPGQALIYYCYDRFDRVVLMQDANTRASNKWIFFKYDRDGRTVMSGLYTNLAYTTRATLQVNIIDPLYAVNTDPYFEERGSALHGYTNQSFPTSPIEVQNVNYYDDYDLNNDGMPDATYQTQGLTGEGSLIASTAFLPTASKKLVLDAGSTWLYNYVFYDTKGRVIQTQSNNHLSSTVNNIVTNVYDFEGKLVTSKTYHYTGPGKEVTTSNNILYDQRGRTTAVLSSSGQSITQQSWQPFSAGLTGLPVQWGNITGVTQNGNTLTKTGGTSNTWDAGAFSLQSIPANSEGWIEFRAGETNTHKMMGLSSTDGNAGYATINYAFYTVADGSLYVYENGAGIALSAPYTVNDILRVERIGTKIVYKQNGITLYTSPTQTAGILYADCSFYNTSSSFTNILLGVGHANNVNVTLNANILTKTGGINATGGSVGWDAGAFSPQSIPADKDGWIEFTAGETTTSKMMGLSSADGGPGYATVNYAIYPASIGSFYIYENGVMINNAPFATYTTSDLFRVERVGTTILYKKNGVTIYTSTVPSSGALYADCSFYHLNATLKNILMVISSWNSASTITSSSGKLQKTSGTTGTWDGATTYRSISTATNGYLEFTAGETNTEKALGLKSAGIVYAIYTSNTGSMQVLENGSAKTALTAFAATDVFRIERTGTTIVYKRNGSVFCTSLSPANGVLYANCGISTVGGSFSNISMGMSDIQIANYQYNELGQLVDKKLHSTDGTNFLQSVDYRYSIKGQLASINNANLDVNSATNDEANDYFGMELMYESVDNNLGTTPCYNGNVSTVKWKGVGTPSGYDALRSYRYTYDNANRLKTAVSQIYSSAANSWVKETGALNETMTYDFNGNIQTLQRNTRQYNMAIVNGVPTVTFNQSPMDNLTYTYNSTMGDQLLTVTDATSNASGFDNGSSGNNTDYTYDANGSLLSDQNKGISNIVYNHLSKPTSIVYTDGRHVDYTYDAAGAKLCVKAYASGGTLLTTTDYVGSFVYVNNTLSFFGSPEGRVVNNNGNLEYQYSIADNQGNTRVVFTSVNPSTTTTATFEDAVADSKVFQNVNTSSMYWVSKSGANNTSGGQYVMRMNYTYPTGPGKSLAVFPGDVVAPEVYAYYEGVSGFGGSNESVAALITSVASAFGGVSGGTGKDGLIYNGVNSAYGSFGSPVNQGDGAPTAHLNYILFDRDYNLLDMGWQAVPTTANMTKQKVSFSTPITIKEPGYMYVYLTYEGGGTNWVYFDDLKIVHTKTNVIQYNEYYPYGLQTNTSWTRDNSTNNFLYNEASEINTTTGWYDLPFRNYDATLGRFVQVDPLATRNGSYSSYHYGFNNPVLFNDPTGAEPDEGPNLPYNWEDNPTGAKFFGGDNAPTSGNTLDQLYEWATAGNAQRQENIASQMSQRAQNQSSQGSRVDPSLYALILSAARNGVLMIVNANKGNAGDAGTQQNDFDEIRRKYGDSFIGQYVIQYIPIAGMDDDQVARGVAKALFGNKDRNLIDVDNPNSACTLQPIRFEIALDDALIYKGDLNPQLLGGAYEYPNPSSLQSNGVASPISVTTESGSQIRWMVYFQKNCIN